MFDNKSSETKLRMNNYIGNVFKITYDIHIVLVDTGMLVYSGRWRKDAEVTLCQ